jgi:2-haloacid dehalogenase
VAAPSAVVFDLGGVLINWDPRHLYRQLFDDEEEMERFLAEVTTAEWNARQDAGRALSDAVAELAARHPNRRDLIAAYYERWPEMLGGAIDGTVEILRELHERGVRVYALSNWSAETFPIARPMFPFLEWFDGIVISGEVKMVKPDPRIFAHVLEKFGLEPGSTVFVDDNAENVRAAETAGFLGIAFVSPTQLRRELDELKLLDRLD